MGVEVWWSSLTAADGDALALLDATERSRLEQLDLSADRARSLVGAALLRVAVAARLEVDPVDVVVDRTCVDCGRPHGAPRVVALSGDGAPVGATPRESDGSASDRAAPWVSVSHSGLLVVVALGDAPVGVDVQRVADLDEPAGAADWVRREAQVKLRGTVVARDGQDAGSGIGGPTTTALTTPLPGYAAALATLGDPGAVVVRGQR